MRQGLRWLLITPGLIAAVGLGFGAAGAADKAKVDQATQQVQQGAKQIGQGNVGTGVKETAKGHRQHDRRGRQVQRPDHQGVLRREVSGGLTRRPTLA